MGRSLRTGINLHDERHGCTKYGWDTRSGRSRGWLFGTRAEGKPESAHSWVRSLREHSEVYDSCVEAGYNTLRGPHGVQNLGIGYIYHERSDFMWVILRAMQC